MKRAAALAVEVVMRVLPLLALMVLLASCDLTGSGGGSGYDTMCVDPWTQLRVADVYCQPGYFAYHPSWVYYVPYGYDAPGFGRRVPHYSRSAFTRPRGATVHLGGIPARGGRGVNLTKTGGGGRVGGGGGYRPQPVRVRVGGFGHH